MGKATATIAENGDSEALPPVDRRQLLAALDAVRPARPKQGLAAAVPIPTPEPEPKLFMAVGSVQVSDHFVYWYALNWAHGVLCSGMAFDSGEAWRSQNCNGRNYHDWLRLLLVHRPWVTFLSPDLDLWELCAPPLEACSSASMASTQLLMPPSKQRHLSVPSQDKPIVLEIDQPVD
jgi:hypothetical protein